MSKPTSFKVILSNKEMIAHNLNGFKSLNLKIMFLRGLSCALIIMALTLKIYDVEILNSYLYGLFYVFVFLTVVESYFDRLRFKTLEDFSLHVAKENEFTEFAYKTLCDVRQGIDIEMLQDSLKVALTDLKLFTIRSKGDGSYREYEVDQEYDAILFLKRKSLPLDEMLKIKDALDKK